MERLPDAAEAADPLLGTWVERTSRDIPARGQVAETELGGRTQDRLYMVTYGDGEADRLLSEEVRRYRLAAAGPEP